MKSPHVAHSVTASRRIVTSANLEHKLQPGVSGLFSDLAGGEEEHKLQPKGASTLVGGADLRPVPEQRAAKSFYGLTRGCPYGARARAPLPPVDEFAMMGPNALSPSDTREPASSQRFLSQ